MVFFIIPISSTSLQNITFDINFGTQFLSYTAMPLNTIILLTFAKVKILIHQQFSVLQISSMFYYLCSRIQIVKAIRQVPFYETNFMPSVDKL